MMSSGISNPKALRKLRTLARRKGLRLWPMAQGRISLVSDDLYLEASGVATAALVAAVEALPNPEKVQR